MGSSWFIEFGMKVFYYLHVYVLCKHGFVLTKHDIVLEVETMIFNNEIECF